MFPCERSPFSQTFVRNQSTGCTAKIDFFWEIILIDSPPPSPRLDPSDIPFTRRGDDEEQAFENNRNQARYDIPSCESTLMAGTSSICDETSHEPLLSTLSLIVETSVRLRREGHRVIIVSSGAIGIGLRRMDMEKKPKRLATVQVIHPSNVWAKSRLLRLSGNVD